MPFCKNCPHGGSMHNWKLPPCSRSHPYGKTNCANCIQQRELRRVRGQCKYPQCECRGYVPNVDRPKPVSNVIGRALYKMH